jgi:hypothetical protein
LWRRQKLACLRSRPEPAGRISPSLTRIRAVNSPAPSSPACFRKMGVSAGANAHFTESVYELCDRMSHRFSTLKSAPGIHSNQGAAAL